MHFIGITLLATGCAVIASLAVFTLRLGISPMPSSFKACSAMLEAAGPVGQADVVDLGSGWGTLAIRYARRHPGCRVVGYELSPIPWAVSVLLKRLLRLERLSFHRKDFRQADLPAGAVLLCYLYPAGMQAVEAKLRKGEWRPALVVSNTFALPSRHPDAVIRLGDLYRTPIYIYRGV
ncbi:class I SAM-dependent methyltransferase [Schlegelella sp. S2-27]|uniref:Class I SAM-dependent methyltransferase n=1 Tax=Caldimonas mangrovi TaxID=2944811 RepID=A0ABT0YRX2_9BURK|nr:class I SAM-dependent methyltransferase [Caldimonas mangrovi]MCM5681503.1 class I SAM-dependent methyltransferase [Caldimonas mangrovi]